MKDGEIVQPGTPEHILTEPANEYVERFVEDVDYEGAYRRERDGGPKEVAYSNEGPTVVLRRMRQAGLSHIFVVDSDRRLWVSWRSRRSPGYERNEQRLGSAVDDGAPKVGRRTSLREVLPLFVEDGTPVAVVDEEDHLEGVIVRGSLIAGSPRAPSTMTRRARDFSGVGVRGEQPPVPTGRGVEMLAQSNVIPRIPLAEWIQSGVN